MKKALLLVAIVMCVGGNVYAKDKTKNKAEAGRKPNAFNACELKAIAIAEAIYKANGDAEESAVITPIQTGSKKDINTYEVSIDTGAKFDLVYNIKLVVSGNSCYFVSAVQPMN